MNTTTFTPDAIAVVEQCIEMLDIENLVEHAVRYVSEYHYAVMDYILDNIEDSEEFTHEEMQYLSKKVSEFMDNYL
jgi:PhoPQ-activated pathogenicity-related protein